MCEFIHTKQKKSWHCLASNPQHCKDCCLKPAHNVKPLNIKNNNSLNWKQIAYKRIFLKDYFYFWYKWKREGVEFILGTFRSYFFFCFESFLVSELSIFSLLVILTYGNLKIIKLLFCLAAPSFPSLSFFSSTNFLTTLLSPGLYAFVLLFVLIICRIYLLHHN